MMGVMGLFTACAGGGSPTNTGTTSLLAGDDLNQAQENPEKDVLTTEAAILACDEGKTKRSTCRVNQEINLETCSCACKAVLSCEANETFDIKTCACKQTSALEVKTVKASEEECPVESYWGCYNFGSARDMGFISGSCTCGYAGEACSESDYSCAYGVKCVDGVCAG